jgi:hypothetical protein
VIHYLLAVQKWQFVVLQFVDHLAVQMGHKLAHKLENMTCVIENRDR